MRAARVDLGGGHEGGAGPHTTLPRMHCRRGPRGMLSHAVEAERPARPDRGGALPPLRVCDVARRHRAGTARAHATALQVDRTHCSRLRGDRRRLWYGHPYHGRKAASGETYDMNQMTAAHRTLPFGTRVRVESLVDGSSVEVRINDRGPFKDEDKRILDLSYAAGKLLGVVGPGVI